VKRIRVIGFFFILSMLVTPASAQSDLERDPDYLAGLAALEDGFYPAAITRFEAYIKNTASVRRKAYGHLFLFQAYYNQGEYERILNLLSENWEMFRGTRYFGAAFYWQARAKHATGNYTDAIHTLRNFDVEFPGDEFQPYALRLYGQALRDAGRLEEAETQFAAFEQRYPGRPEIPENLLDRAGLLIKLGRSEQASDVLKKLTDDFPNNLAAHRARLLLARSALDNQRQEEATRWIADLVDDARVPREIRAESWFLSARIRVDQGNPTNALDALEKGEILTTNTGRRVEARIDRAILLMELDRLDEAMVIMNNTVVTLAATPQASRALLELADLLRGQQQYEKAEAAYQRYLESFSDSTRVHDALHNKGWCLWQLNRFPEAATTFEKAYAALSKDPDTADLRRQTQREEALAKAADSYFMSGQFRPAASCYEKAATEFPESKSRLPWIYQAGESYARLGDFTNAVRSFMVVAGDSSVNEGLAASAWMRLGRFYEDQRRFEPALEAYSAIIQRFPEGRDAASAWLARGILRYRLADYEAARADFEKTMTSAGAATDEHQQAYMMRAWCAYQLGNTSAALAMIDEFLLEFPASTMRPQALFWIAEHQFNVRELRAAESNFFALAKAHPKSNLAAPALYWAGRAALEQKLFRRALDEYLALFIRNYPAHSLVPEVRFWQGDALTELGDFAGAVLAFEQITTRFPEHPLAIRAWGRIGDCQFTIGTDEQYARAVETFRSMLVHPAVSKDLALQAEYKLARTYERLKRNEEASRHYLNVVYAWLAASEEGQPVDEIWFVRSAFGAASLKEAAGDLDGAVAIYTRVAFSGTGAAGDAKIRIDRIRNQRQKTGIEQSAGAGPESNQ